MVVGSGEPSAVPPGIRFGIPAFAHSRLLALAFQASLADQRRRISTGLPLAKGIWSKPGWPCSFMSSGGGEILAQDGRCCTVKMGRPLKIRRFRQTQNIFLCRFSGFSPL